MLTLASATEYAARVTQGAYRLSNARFYQIEPGLDCVAIDLDVNGEAHGTIDVWIENGALYGEW